MAVAVMTCDPDPPDRSTACVPGSVGRRPAPALLVERTDAVPTAPAVPVSLFVS